MAQAAKLTTARAAKIGAQVIAMANDGYECLAYAMLYNNGLHVSDLIEAGWGMEEVDAVLRGFTEWSRMEKWRRIRH